MQFAPGTHRRAHPRRGWCWYCGEVVGVAPRVAARVHRMRRWRLLGLVGLVAGLCWCLSPQATEAGKGIGEDASYTRDMEFEQRLFYVAAGNGVGQIEYICRAFPGTTGSDDVNAAVWQVKRLTYDSNHNIATMAMAGDDDAFNQVCANRASLNYD